MRSVKVSIKEYANGSKVRIEKSWGGSVTKVVQHWELVEYLGFLRQLYEASGIEIGIIREAT